MRNDTIEPESYRKKYNSTQDKAKAALLRILLFRSALKTLRKSNLELNQIEATKLQTTKEGGVK
jgi:hypothetical protein